MRACQSLGSKERDPAVFALSLTYQLVGHICMHAVALGTALPCSTDRYLFRACLGSEQGLSQEQHRRAGTGAAPHVQGGGTEARGRQSLARSPKALAARLGPGKWLFPKRQLSASLCVLRSLLPKAMCSPCGDAWCPGCFERLPLFPPGAAPDVRGCCTHPASCKTQVRWVGPVLSL